MPIVLQIVLAIVGVGGGLFLIISVFFNYILSRLVSLGFSITALVMAFPLYEQYVLRNQDHYYDQKILYSYALISLGLLLVSFLFFVGEAVFEVDWDGTFSIQLFLDRVEINRDDMPRLFWYLLIFLPLLLIINLLVAPTHPGWLFVMPALMIFITVLGFLIRLFNSR